MGKRRKAVRPKKSGCGPGTSSFLCSSYEEEGSTFDTFTLPNALAKMM